MKRYCRNCFYPLPNKAKFCTHCGQKDSDGKVRMSTMLRKLWDTTFHLEGKFLRTCWQLYIPGKLTTEFFKGKQDRYPHPLRMFAIVMFLFLFMLNRMLKDAESDRSGSIFSISKDTNTGNRDSVKTIDLSLYEEMKYQAVLYDMRHDYENLPPEWKTAASRKAVDSLLKKNNLRNGITEAGLLDSLDNDSDTSSFGLWKEKQIRIATLDIVRYEPDEIIRRYGIKDWILQLFVRQTIKSYKDPDSLVHSYIGSLTWAILALVSIMSGILALLYWRQKRYYVEHFIFLLHFHTGLMLALLLSIIGIQLGLWNEVVFAFIFLGATFFMYRALRGYYGQGRGKTIVKWLIFGIAYYFSFVLLMVLGLLLVFAIY